MKIFTGKVIKANLPKTATVAVERIIVHPVYKKRYKRSKKYLVHAENEVAVGQVVKFVACRPYSKTKRWKIVEKAVEAKKEVKKAVKAKEVKK